MQQQQLVRFRKRSNNNNQLIRAAAAISATALQQLITSKGEGWVIQQISNGAINLSKAAANWWASSSKPVVETISQVPAPASVGVALRGNAKLNGSIRIKHRELAFTQDGGSASSFRINPADPNSFPYLSILARAYDKYRFHSVRLYVVSAVPTSSGGRYYVAWEPDSNDSAPASVASYMAMQHSMTMSSWQSGVLPIPAMTDSKLINFLPDDLKDHGKVFLTNTNTGSGLFDIYLEYDVTLSEPNLDMPTQALTTAMDNVIASGRVSSSYGPEMVASSSPLTNKTFILAPGVYQIVANVRAATVTPGPWLVSDLGTGGSSLVAQRAVSSSGEVTRIVIASISSYGATVTIGDTFTTPTVGKSNMLVAPISGAAAVSLTATLS